MSLWSYPPGIYRHYKGNYYQLLHIARDSENGPNEGRLRAIYMGLDTEGSNPGLRICDRPLKEFSENIMGPDGEYVTRFLFVGHAWKESMT